MLEPLSAHSYTQAQLGERMQEEWAASLERGQQRRGGGGRHPGAAVLDACTLDPKAWRWENVPCLLCPLRSGNTLLQLPGKWGARHTVFQKPGSVCSRLRAVDHVCTCSKAQWLGRSLSGTATLSRTSSSANLEMAKDNRNSWESPACPPPQRPCKWSGRP